MRLTRSNLPQQFADLFLKTVKLTEEEFEIVLSHYWRENLPQKFYYLKVGQICDQTGYISKGCTRQFTTDSKGREHILNFAFEDWIIGDLESYYTGSPTIFNIQALEDCELYCIHKKDMDALEEHLPRLKEWHLAKQRKAHHASVKRLTEVKTLTAEERYLNLIEKYPHIFQRVPLRDIACYLDIEPQSLSRLRKRITVK